MKNEIKKFNLKERIKKWENESAKLLYDLASDLLNLVDDEDVLLLYEDNNEIFAKLSSSSKEEILNNSNLLEQAIDILIEYLSDRPITEEEYENMSFEELFNYIEYLIDKKEVTLLDVIRYLESK